MARYEHLPIFKKSYDLALFSERLIKDFSRYHKYGIGQEIGASARSILLSIVGINNTEDKLPGLDELRLQLAKMQILVRLAKDMKALPGFKAFERLSMDLDNISRQTEGWRKSVLNQQKRG